MDVNSSLSDAGDPFGPIDPGGTEQCSARITTSIDYTTGPTADLDAVWKAERKVSAERSMLFTLVYERKWRGTAKIGSK